MKKTKQHYQHPQADSITLLNSLPLALSLDDHYSSHPSYAPRRTLQDESTWDEELSTSETQYGSLWNQQ